MYLCRHSGFEHRMRARPCQLPRREYTPLPDIPVPACATEAIMRAAIVLLSWYMFSRDRNHLPFCFFPVGILYVGREMLSILAPLGRPSRNLDSYGVSVVIDLQRPGMVPSGRTMLAAAIYLLIDVAGGGTATAWTGETGVSAADWT